MSLALWRDIAIVILAIQLFVILLIPLAIAYFGTRGLSWIHTRLSTLLARARGLSHQVRAQADRLSDVVAAPLIRVHSRAARLRTLWQGLRRA